MTQQGTHENFAREKQATPGSERSFAITMAVVLALLAAINWWHGGRVWPWLGGISFLFVLGAYLFPAALKPLNLLWFKLGLALHAVVNPIILGLVFYGAVLPTGLVMRALSKDPLRLKFQPNCKSYWIARQPPGPAPETMKNQF